MCKTYVTTTDGRVVQDVGINDLYKKKPWLDICSTTKNHTSFPPKKNIEISSSWRTTSKSKTLFITSQKEKQLQI